MPQFIQKMMLETYDEQGRSPESIWTSEPDWPRIDAALHALDRFRYPFVWFYLNSEAADGDIPDFEIIGGDGAYGMQAHVDGKPLQFFNNDAGDGTVDIWLSDQGATVPEKWICTDFGRVLSATGHFFQTGSLDPNVNWVSWESVRDTSGTQH